MSFGRPIHGRACMPHWPRRQCGTGTDAPNAKADSKQCSLHMWCLRCLRLRYTRACQMSVLGITPLYQQWSSAKATTTLSSRVDMATVMGARSGGQSSSTRGWRHGAQLEGAGRRDVVGAFVSLWPAQAGGHGQSTEHGFTS